MFNENINDEVIYEPMWSDIAPDKSGNNPALSRLFDNLFGWIDPVDGAGFYKNQNQLAKALVEQDPSLDIQSLEDGFELEARRLDAIRQRSSRGFTIIDINPGLLTEQDAPLSIPFEFLYDGSNFIPDQTDSIIKNFRTVQIECAGDFVKVEYIYENNSNANAAPSNRRPYSHIKYGQAIKNGSEENLVTGYENYYFDNFARNKVYLGFGDANQKPHLITKSGDYFKTYFNTLAISFNIGAPKIRLTIGYNSEKHDGDSDSDINSQLHLTGGARLFKNIDTPLMPMNLGVSDTFKPTPSTGVQLNSTTSISSFDVSLVRAISGLNAPLNDYNTSFGYSLLFISDLIFFYRLGSSSLGFNICIELLVSNAAGQEVRLFKMPYTFDVTAGSKLSDTIAIPFSSPIRVVIPYNNRLVARVIYQSGGVTTFNYDIIIQGYSLGNIRKIDASINYEVISSKFITDSTFLTDFNRIEALRDA